MQSVPRKVMIYFAATNATIWNVVDNKNFIMRPYTNGQKLTELDNNDTIELSTDTGKFEGTISCEYAPDPGRDYYLLGDDGPVGDGGYLDLGATYTMIIGPSRRVSLEETALLFTLTLKSSSSGHWGGVNLTGKLYGNGPKEPPPGTPPASSSRKGAPTDARAPHNQHKPDNGHEDKDMTTNDTGTLLTQKTSDNTPGLYFVKAVVGNAGVPGAPSVTLALVVQAASGHVSGLAEISQALPPSQGHYRFPVSGQIHHTGLGADQQLVALSGEFIYSVPPPAIGSFIARFTAALAVDKNWNGSGGFNYLDRHVENAPVKKLS